MRISLRQRILFLFAMLAAGTMLIVGSGLLLGWRQMPEARPALIIAGLISGFGIAVLTALMWLLFDDRLARPLTRLASVLRIRTHGGVGADPDLRDLHHLGDLGPAAEALCCRLTDDRTASDQRIANAVREKEQENARLAAILSDIPVAIMIVDEANRVMLYDRQCVHVLSHVATLGLGRPIFDYFDRDSIAAALSALHGRATRNFLDVDLVTAGGRGTVAARLRRAEQGRGFMLAMEVEDDTTAERPLVFDFDLMGSMADRTISDTPLSALNYVVFDTETTGLDTARDEIVQIGAVRVLNDRIVAGEIYDTLVDPGRPIPAVSARIHGITDERVAGAPDVAAALDGLHRFARGSVLVAHNAPFDLSFLKRGAAPSGIAFDHPVLDTVLLSAVVFGSSDPLTLDAIADRLGIRVDATARHTAIGDAQTTAAVLLRLLPILEAKGIRTFGEAVAAMRQHARLLPDVNRD